MKESFYKAGNHNPQNTFGGFIYLSDYNNDYRSKKLSQGSVIASRIARDRRFDEQCKRNIEMRANGKNQVGKAIAPAIQENGDFKRK